MRIICLLFLTVCFSINQTYAQFEVTKEGQKEQRKIDKSEKKKEKAKSVGVLAEEAGKRIWDNVKGFLNVVLEDVVEKKEKFTRKEESKEQVEPSQTEKPVPKETPKKKSKN